jgi:succinate dehydrogenase hydrophobic anchor subunit
LLSGSKFLIFPQLVTTLVLYFLINNKQLNKNFFLLIIFLICGAASFKLNFFISGFILGIFALTKINFNYKLIFQATLIALVFFFAAGIRSLLDDVVYEEVVKNYLKVKLILLLFLCFLTLFVFLFQQRDFPASERVQEIAMELIFEADVGNFNVYSKKIKN